MTFTKETWIGLAGVATLLAYFFWPKKASAAVMTTTTSPTAPPKPYTATTTPKPAEKPFVPYGTPDGPPGGSDTWESSGTPEDAAKAVEKGVGEIGDVFGIAGVRGSRGAPPGAGYQGDRYRHGMPQSWWAASLPRVTGADLGMWTPPVRSGATGQSGAHSGAGPHLFPFGYQGTSAWPGPAPVLPIIPGFSDYDIGYNYGKQHCTTGAPLMMRPANPSDDWLTGYDEGCQDGRRARRRRQNES